MWKFEGGQSDASDLRLQRIRALPYLHFLPGPHLPAVIISTCHIFLHASSHSAQSKISEDSKRKNSIIYSAQVEEHLLVLEFAASK